MDSVSFKKKSKKIKELGEKKKDGNIRRFERERMENGSVKVYIKDNSNDKNGIKVSINIFLFV